MDQKQYDDLMIEALKSVKEEEFSDVPKEEHIEYEFSDEFIERANELVKDKKKSMFGGFVQHTAKRVAVAVMVLIVGISTILITKAYKEPILDFEYKFAEDGSDYRVYYSEDGNDMYKKIETFYTPAVVPIGYECDNVLENVLYKGSRITWQDKEHNNILFHQETATEVKYAVAPDIPVINVEERKINGIGCLCIETEKEYKYTWKEKGYAFVLVCFSKNVGEDYVENVVGKLIEVDLSRIDVWQQY